MTDESSTKPYLIRAIHEWCTDAGYTPHLMVRVDENTRVPMAYVKDGTIILNLGVDAVKDLHLGNEEISCGGRFGGVAHQIRVPVRAVTGIFARENGQGLAFQETAPSVTPDQEEKPAQPSSGKPRLTLVK